MPISSNCSRSSRAIDLPAVGRDLANHWTTRVVIEPGPQLSDAIAREAATAGVHAAGTVVKASSAACGEGVWDLHLFALADGLRLALGVLDTPAVRSTGSRVAAPLDTSDAAVAAHAIETLGCYYHPVGTCSIGRVVDGRGAVHGAEELYVADASIMPTIRARTRTCPCSPLPSVWPRRSEAGTRSITRASRRRTSMFGWQGTSRP